MRDAPGEPMGVAPGGVVVAPPIAPGAGIDVIPPADVPGAGVVVDLGGDPDFDAPNVVVVERGAPVQVEYVPYYLPPYSSYSLGGWWYSSGFPCAPVFYLHGFDDDCDDWHWHGYRGYAHDGDRCDDDERRRRGFVGGAVVTRRPFAGERDDAEQRANVARRLLAANRASAVAGTQTDADGAAGVRGNRALAGAPRAASATADSRAPSGRRFDLPKLYRQERGAADRGAAGAAAPGVARSAVPIASGQRFAALPRSASRAGGSTGQVAARQSTPEPAAKSGREARTNPFRAAQSRIIQARPAQNGEPRAARAAQSTPTPRATPAPRTTRAEKSPRSTPVVRPAPTGGQRTQASAPKSTASSTPRSTRAQTPQPKYRERRP